MNLTKEQKQYLAVGGGVSVVFVLLVFFGIKAGFASARGAEQELEDLTGRIELAKHSLQERAKMAEERGKMAVELEGLLQNLPPRRNYYSWASEIIYQVARYAKLDVDAIDELERAHVPSSKKGRSKKKKPSGIQMEYYSLKITAHGTYEDLKKFMLRMEEKHPMVHVTGLNIQPGADPEVHDVQIVLQWPFNFESVKRACESLSPEQDDPVVGGEK